MICIKHHDIFDTSRLELLATCIVQVIHVPIANVDHLLLVTVRVRDAVAYLDCCRALGASMMASMILRPTLWK